MNFTLHNRTKAILRQLAIVIVCFFIIILVGSAIIGSMENMRFLDAFYLNMMTATTIGYGDFVPTTDGSKMFISFYSLLSVGTFFYMLGLIAVVNIQEAEKTPLHHTL